VSVAAVAGEKLGDGFDGFLRGCAHVDAGDLVTQLGVADEGLAAVADERAARGDLGKRSGQSGELTCLCLCGGAEQDHGGLAEFDLAHSVVNV